MVNFRCRFLSGLIVDGGSWCCELESCTLALLLVLGRIGTGADLRAVLLGVADNQY